MKINIKDILKFYKFLNHKNETEIRAINPNSSKVESHFVNCKEAFVDVCKSLNGKFNLYVGINERTQNGKEDKDVIVMTCVGHDIDCHNEDSSLDAAETAVNLYKEDCISHGGKEPLILFSGGGYWIFHLLTPISNTDENKEKIKEFGRIMKNKYEKPGFEFDTKVYNPSRIARIPGTINIKSGKLAAIISSPPTPKQDSDLSNKILEIKLPTYEDFEHVDIPKGSCAFLDYCITHKLPEGERHEVISRNLALYIYDRKDREQLRQQYIKSQGGKPLEVNTWLNSIAKNPDKKFPFSCGQLINYQRKHKIPFQCEDCPLFKKYNKQKPVPKGWARVLSIKKISKEYNLYNCPKCNRLFDFKDSHGYFYCDGCKEGGGLKKFLKLCVLKSWRKKK